MHYRLCLFELINWAGGWLHLLLRPRLSFEGHVETSRTRKCELGHVGQCVYTKSPMKPTFSSKSGYHRDKVPMRANVLNKLVYADDSVGSTDDIKGYFPIEYLNTQVP